MAALPAAGDLIGDKYRIEARLGLGGMGAVFRAHHEVIDKPVALKWLHPTFAEDPFAQERFIREARLAARVRHPNVIEVYDVGVHERAPFIVMELLEGETFEAILRRGDMPIPKALALLIGSMHGVAAAHRLSIVHRDIKPENIFVVYDAQHPDGLAKVLDFGVSKSIDELRKSNMTRTGATMGTPLYMSFEQMDCASDVDARTDIYSFGVLLYRALTGRLPFEADSLAALAVAVATDTPPTPKRLRPELPSAIDRVVLKAMARDRNDRYANLDELIGGLTELASNQGFLGHMTQPATTAPLLTPKTPARPIVGAPPQPSTEVVDVSAAGPVERSAPPPRSVPRLRRALIPFGLLLALLASLAWTYWKPHRGGEPVRASIGTKSEPATHASTQPNAAPEAPLSSVTAPAPLTPIEPAPALPSPAPPASPREVAPRRTARKPDAAHTSDRPNAPVAASASAAEPTPGPTPPPRAAKGQRSGTLRLEEL